MVDAVRQEVLATASPTPLDTSCEDAATLPETRAQSEEQISTASQNSWEAGQIMPSWKTKRLWHSFVFHGAD
jgi:anti-sigma-K factor RskA